MISILDENILTLDEARQLLPGVRPGTPMSIATIYRHASVGIRGVKLETLACGGRIVTTREAIQRFVEAVTAARQAGRKAATSETPTPAAAERQRASEAAAREADAWTQRIRSGRKRKAAPTVQATA